MGYLLALASSIVWGFSDFFGGTLSRRTPPLAIVGCSYVASVLAVTVLMTARGDLSLARAAVGWAVVAGIVGLLAIVAFYAALATGTMGVVSPIAALGVAVPVLVGLVEGERPSPVQLAGIAVAVIGVVIASGPELRGHPDPARRASAARPLLLAVVAGAGFGFFFVALARGSAAGYDVFATLLVMRLTSLGAILLIAIGLRSVGGLSLRTAGLAALVGIAEITANGLYAFSSRHGLLSIVSVLGSLYPAVTVVLARVVHSERMTRGQDAGVAAALVGVVLIAGG
jgi:drug/metabolite transporter (DMT)-like permease